LVRSGTSGITFVPTRLCLNGMQKVNLTSDCGSERNEAGEEDQQEGRLKGNAIAVSLITDPATQIRLWKCIVSSIGFRGACTCDYVYVL
jgi:hypothetical protein